MDASAARKHLVAGGCLALAARVVRSETSSWLCLAKHHDEIPTWSPLTDTVRNEKFAILTHVSLCLGCGKSTDVFAVDTVLWWHKEAV